MNDIIRRITGPDAISLPATLVLAAVMFFSNHNSSGIGSTSFFWEINLAWALSISVAFAWLWAAKWWMRRSGNQQPLVWKTISAFVIAFVLRALVFDAAVFYTGASDSHDLVYRLFASLPTFGFGLVICAYIVSLAREFSRNLKHISALGSELDDLNRTVAERVSQHRTELVTYIQATLRKELRAAMGAAPQDVVDRMKSTIEQVVRPVSRQLVVSVPDFEIPLPPAGLRIAWTSVFRNIFEANPLRPMWFGFWVAGAAWSISITRNSLLETLVFVSLVFLSSWAGMAIVSLGWQFVCYSANWTRAVFVTMSGPIVGFGVNLAVQWYEPIAQTQSQMIFSYAFISLGIVWFIATVTSLRRVTISSNVSVQEVELELHEAQVFVNTKLREQQLTISRALHGPVQDRIFAAVFTLSGALSDNKVTEQLVSDLVASIESVIDQMSYVEPRLTHVERVIAELAQLWEGVVCIQSNIENNAANALLEFQASANTVAEVIREACANAIRHGEATSISIVIESGERPQTLRVTVANDGLALGQANESGVGSILLDELTLEWSRESRRGLTYLSAVVPLV